MSEGSKANTSNKGLADNAADTSAEKNQTTQSEATSDQPTSTTPAERPTEYGGQKGLEPTRYGDWEKNGRCTDF